MQEKRRHPRVAVNIPVLCEIPNTAPFPAVIVDLSVGGLLIESEVTPPFGTELIIGGEFPSGPGLKLPAIVRWARPPGFGVQFGLLGAHETRVLTTILKSQRLDLP